MKKALFFLFASLLLTFSATAHADIGGNIQLQQDQIISDAKTGRLRQMEARTLMENLNRIKSEYRRAKSDGHVNLYENQRLNHMLLDNAAAIRRYRKQ